MQLVLQIILLILTVSAIVGFLLFTISIFVDCKHRDHLMYLGARILVGSTILALVSMIVSKCAL
jgi:hypothetical protein